MVWKNVLFLQFPGIKCPINESETRERELHENSRGCMSRGSHRNLLLRSLIQEIVQYQEPNSIYPRCAPAYL